MEPPDRPRVLSFGGGVQSSALVALLGSGQYPGEPPQEVWFCDPKNERPETYDWIEGAMSRHDCRAINEQVFAAQPVKSGCWFCKYQRPAQWRAVWEQRSDGRWDEAVAWERAVMAKHGRAGAFIDAGVGRKALALDEWARRWALGEQLPLAMADARADEGACDGGYCMV